MSVTELFISPEEAALARDLLDKGYVVREVTDRGALDALRQVVVSTAAQHLGLPEPEDAGRWLDTIHERVPVEKLNALRLAIFNHVNNLAWARPTIFKIGRPYLEALIGNELAMQNKVNLSIQMPEDNSSLLEIHADVFAAESPFQAVQWLPIVDAFATKSMFILPPARSREVTADLKSYEHLGMNGLFDAFKSELVWLDVPYGSVLIFSPNILHGNTVNHEGTTRWSFNTRFAPLLGPSYSASKALGTYYSPITVKATTRIGIAYRGPTGFRE